MGFDTIEINLVPSENNNIMKQDFFVQKRTSHKKLYVYRLGVVIIHLFSKSQGCASGCHYTAKNKNFLLKKFFSSFHTAIAQSR